MQRQFYSLTWAEFKTAVQYLAELTIGIDQSAPIYGAPRGGLCLAVALSHATGRKLVLEPQDGMIWVDDIVESGQTYNKAKSENSISLALCWVCVSPRSLPIGYAYAEDSNKWIVFPWEDETKARADMEEYENSRQ